MEDLKKKRKSTRAKLTRLQTSGQSFSKKESKSLSLIKILRDSIRDYFKEFASKSEIGAICYDTEEDAIREDKVTSEVESKYYDVLSFVEDIIPNLSFCEKAKDQIPSDNFFNLIFSQDQKNVINVPLPPINLPKFSGEYTDYHNFIERFNKTVDSNKFISDADKLAYLKGCVIGDAVGTINALSICESNYQVALQLLNKRYANLRIIVQGHINNILDSPSLAKNPQNR